MDIAAREIYRRYAIALASSTVVLFLTIFACAWFLVVTERAALRAENHELGKQLALALESAIDVVRGHAFAAQRTVEHALILPGAAASQGNDAILAESGALYVDPKAELDPILHRRNLAAASAILPVAAAAHQWRPAFQWAYYYDARARWFLIYPYLSQEDLFRATRTSDLTAALRVLFDANGTRPLEMIGPHDNPGRDMRWTPSYLDTGGKGRMVTLLAPVYLADEFVGAVGTDVTLGQMYTILGNHAPRNGRALVVDHDGTLLADQGGAPQGADRPSTFAELFPGLANLPGEGDAGWLRFSLRGTDWTLLIQETDSELYALVFSDHVASFAMAGLLLAALLALTWIQHRRYAGPALRLASYIAGVDRGPDLPPPAAPGFWQPLFERVALAARERKELLNHTRAQAEALEREMVVRTADLSATSVSLQQTREDLVRADKLGSLGGLVAGVSREIDAPLRQAVQGVADLQQGLGAFREHQQRGLRRAELDAFVTTVGEQSEQLARQLREATDMLQRFRQLAVDQVSEEVRRFNLREVVENVLVSLRPTIKRQGCTVHNAIGDELELVADAGTISQIFSHVLSDAIMRSDPGHSLQLLAGWAVGSSGEVIDVTVSDGSKTPADASSAGLAMAARLLHQVPGARLEVHTVEGSNRLILRIPAVAKA